MQGRHCRFLNLIGRYNAPSPPNIPVGGTASFRVGTQNKTTDPPVLCYHIPPSLSLLVFSPFFSRYQRTAHCYYCCYCNLSPVDTIFSYPDTSTLMTVAKTLIIANPGCFPWTSHNYSPNRKCPFDSPPSGSSWVCDSPLFSSLQPQLWESVLQWVPKTRASAPPPPPPPPPGQHPTDASSNCPPAAQPPLSQYPAYPTSILSPLSRCHIATFFSLSGVCCLQADLFRAGGEKGRGSLPARMS